MAIKARLSNGYLSVTDLSIGTAGTLLIRDYVNAIADSDVLDKTDLTPVLQGLYGEVGGIMATAKKHVREGAAYPGFRRAAEEEFGDTLWYLAALCRRININLDQLFAEAIGGSQYQNVGAASDRSDGAIAYIVAPVSTPTLDSTLFQLGKAAATLLDPPPTVELVRAFAQHYLDALHAAQMSFANVARANVYKARGAFIVPKLEDLIDFDKDFDKGEQLPRKFRIRVNQRDSGKSYLQWNGVFIGDPLTDNIADRDGYRFHDVFHFAYAAILHWSPVIRALIKQKRKSRPTYDEEQDGGRAIVVEEGLTAWIFARAKELKYFEGQSRLSLGLLKTVQQFVGGYEVDRCPLKLWERAILDGYTVFRQLRDANGGWIVGDRTNRSIHYEPLEPLR